MNHPNRAFALTAREIEAVLAVAQNAEAYETFRDEGPVYAARMTAAFERGIDKLKARLTRLNKET